MPKGKRKAEAVASKAKGNNAPLVNIIRLVRKDKKTGRISSRGPGRPHPSFEYGYTSNDVFHLGNPPVDGRSKRRKAVRKNHGVNRGINPAAGYPNQQVPAQAQKKASGLDAINDIVKREVNSRLQAAKAAALEAFNRALG